MVSRLGAQQKSLYDVLGIDPASDSETIRTAYINRIKQVHPDLHPGREDEAKQVNFAYEVLSNSRRRADYDDALRGAVCPYCNNRVANPAEAAQHLRIHIEEAQGVGDGCAVCGRGPAAPFSLRANQGFLLWREAYGFDGNLCKSCALGAFREFQARNLIRGWWGFISFFATLGYLLYNLKALASLKDLRSPVPAVEDAERAFRGRPVFQRTGVWGALAVLLVLGIAAGASSSNSQEQGVFPDTFGAAPPLEIPSFDPPALPPPKLTCDSAIVNRGLTQAARAHGAAVSAVNKYVSSGSWGDRFRPSIISRISSVRKRLERIGKEEELTSYGRRLLRQQNSLLTLDVTALLAVDSNQSLYNSTVDQVNSLSERLGRLFQRDSPVCKFGFE